MDIDLVHYVLILVFSKDYLEKSLSICQNPFQAYNLGIYESVLVFFAAIHHNGI